MNNSGIAVQHLKRFFKIENKNIIVFYDELDLKSGQCKIKIGGGDNGHNGIKSIDSLCGKDYLKLKIGIGRPTIQEMEISHYVLSDLSKNEIDHINKIGELISKSIGDLFDKDGQSVLLNKISKIKI
jgi:PTH1 family peptidyl-tRNA hydrolase